MNEINLKIEFLEKRLNDLVKTQISFQTEIAQIRKEIENLRQTAKSPIFTENVQARTPTEFKENIDAPPPKTAENQTDNFQDQQRQYFPSITQTNFGNRQNTSIHDTEPSEKRSNLEKFIGENLISKIGIVILIIGVAIGAKYAIDKNLVSPLMRIVFGYFVGFGLLGFAFKFREKYLNFSAVLLSGAMAIMYFITFFAYSLYGLFTQPTAFVLMLIFTLFTVVSAIMYNRQIIAQIGLVGAYAIPFLLSNNSGKYAFLFTYVAIINIGILAVSVKKYWKSLHFSSFIITWLIFAGWFVTKYHSELYFNFALFFLTVNFLTFYITFIAYKVINIKHIALENISLILANAFIFYGFGYLILDGHSGFENYLGIFTLVNALIHFVFAFTVSRFASVTKDLIYLLSALIITFATIAVPVQLNGNFVTLIWTIEAAVLFWIGRTKTVKLFEIYSFPLMLLASANLFLDWFYVYDSRNFSSISENSTPFYNGTFFTSIFYAAAFLFIFLTNRAKEFVAVINDESRNIFGAILAAIFTFAFYNAFRMEISNYFYHLTVTTAVNAENNLLFDNSLEYFNTIWQINFTLFYLTLLSIFNIAKAKNAIFTIVNLILNWLATGVFVLIGLLVLSQIRETYLLQTDAEYFTRGVYFLYIRYISYVFAAGLILASFICLKQKFLTESKDKELIAIVFDLSFFTALLFISSSELLHWMDIFGYQDSYKLGLSILWGIYALILIILGIYKNKKHLRISAIALFGVTLAKLFFYDIAELGTISKTIVFVSLGILLLIVSFLYTKYKDLIFGLDEEKENLNVKS